MGYKVFFTNATLEPQDLRVFGIRSLQFNQKSDFDLNRKKRKLVEWENVDFDHDALDVSIRVSEVSLYTEYIKLRDYAT